MDTGSFSREGQAILCDAMWFFYTWIWCLCAWSSVGGISNSEIAGVHLFFLFIFNWRIPALHYHAGCCRVSTRVGCSLPPFPRMFASHRAVQQSPKWPVKWATLASGAGVFSRFTPLAATGVLSDCFNFSLSECEPWYLIVTYYLHFFNW